MLVFCIPSVWPPHDDEEPPLTTYGCPPFPEHSASATHPTNSPRGRNLVLITQEEKLYLDHLLYFIRREVVQTVKSVKDWTYPTVTWHGIIWTELSSEVNLAGGRFTHFSPTGEKWNTFKLTWTDAGWCSLISSRILSYKQLYSEPPASENQIL